MQPERGWYPDPESPSRHRWWDGSAWTDDIQPASPTGGLISSGRIAHPPPARPRRTISALLFPPVLVATAFVIVLTFAAQRTVDVPDGAAARQAAETLADHLQGALALEPTNRFSGSVVEDPGAADDMFMELGTCASGRLRHQDLTSISGAEVRDPAADALLMVGTGDRDANRAYVDGLVAQSQDCANGTSGREQLQVTVDDHDGRLQLIDIQQQGEGSPVTWVFVARAEADRVASGYVSTTIDIEGDELARRMLDAIDAAMDAATESATAAVIGGTEAIGVRP